MSQTLGDELAVGVGHGVACDAEVGGEGTRGRQPQTGWLTAARRALSAAPAVLRIRRS